MKMALLCTVHPPLLDSCKKSFNVITLYWNDQPSVLTVSAAVTFNTTATCHFATSWQKGMKWRKLSMTRNVEFDSVMSCDIFIHCPFLCFRQTRPLIGETQQLNWDIYEPHQQFLSFLLVQYSSNYTFCVAYCMLVSGRPTVQHISDPGSDPSLAWGKNDSFQDITIIVTVTLCPISCSLLHL